MTGVHVCEAVALSRLSGAALILNLFLAARRAPGCNTRLRVEHGSASSLMSTKGTTADSSSVRSCNAAGCRSCASCHAPRYGQSKVPSPAANRQTPCQQHPAEHLPAGLRYHTHQTLQDQAVLSAEDCQNAQQCPSVTLLLLLLLWLLLLWLLLLLLLLPVCPACTTDTAPQMILALRKSADMEVSMGQETLHQLEASQQQAGQLSSAGFAKAAP